MRVVVVKERIPMGETAWVRQLFQTIDAKDTEGFLSFLSDNAQLRFGSAPVLVGKDAIREAIDGFFAGIHALQHHIIRTWAHPDTVICQGEVTYTRADRSQVTLPFMNLFAMESDHINQYLIYIDLAPLYSTGS